MRVSRRWKIRSSWIARGVGSAGQRVRCWWRWVQRVWESRQGHWPFGFLRPWRWNLCGSHDRARDEIKVGCAEREMLGRELWLCAPLSCVEKQRGVRLTRLGNDGRPYGLRTRQLLFGRVRHHADRIHTKIRCVFYQLSAASTTWRKFSVCQCCHLHHLLPLLLATPTLLCIEVINCS